MIKSMPTFMPGPLGRITNFYVERLLISSSIAIVGYFAMGIFKEERVVNQIKIEVIYK